MRNKTAIVFATGLVLAGFFFFKGLSSGTSTDVRALQVFGSRDAIQKLSPELVRLRNQFYEKRSELLSGSLPRTVAEVQAVNAAYGAAFQDVPREAILNGMRGFLIGVIPADEQQTLAGLSKLRPQHLQFDPGNYTYGGFFYYTEAAALAVGSLTGLYRLTGDTAYYFHHPDDVAGIYCILRGLSAVVLIMAGLLFLLMPEPLSVRVLAALLFLLNPVTIVYSHAARPHALGTLFAAAVLVLLSRKPLDARRLFWAGLLTGLSTGAAYTNGLLLLFITLVWVETETPRPSLLSAFWPFLGAFLLTNPYWFTSLSKIYGRFITEHWMSYGQGRLLPAESLSFLPLLFWEVFTPAGMFLIGLEMLRKVQGKSVERAAVVFLLFGVAADAVWMRHAGLLLPFIPWAAWLAARGAGHLWDSRRWLAVLLCGGWLASNVLHAAAYQSLWTRHGTMTEAGAWINAQIPPGSAVGLPGGKNALGVCPPFEFLRYRIVNVPEDNVLPAHPAWPEYLVIVPPNLPAGWPYETFRMFQGGYHTWNWTVRCRVPVATENNSVGIYRLRKS